MITQNELYNTVKALFPSYTIFEDIGEYVAAYRNAGANTLTVPICGIFQVSPFNYIAANGIKITKVAATLEILPSREQMPGVRDTVNSVAAVNSNQTVVMEDSDEISYTVTTWYSSAQVGQEQASPSNTGKVIPVTMYMQFDIFENGVNGNNILLYIDGKQIHYTEINFARPRTLDSVPKQTGNAQAKILNTNFSITFNAPLLSTDGSDILKEATFNPSTNTAHCVEVRIKDTSYYYLMTFGNCINTSVPGQNAGIQINLHETSGDEVEHWGAQWGVYEVNGNIAYIDASTDTVVFWGDGKAEMIDEYTSHPYTDGLTKHTVVTFGSTPLTWRPLRVDDNLYGHTLKYIGTPILNDEGVITFITCTDGSKFMLDAQGVFREYDWEGSYTEVTEDVELWQGIEWTSILHTVNYINPNYIGDFVVKIAEMGL